jgi:hypothetical protein
MTQIAPRGRIAFDARFRCGTGQVALGDKFAITGRVLAATEAGAFDIPLMFTDLSATAK